MERGLLSSDVISEHSLHIFVRKHLQRTSDFLDVAPDYSRRVRKTGLRVSLNLEGHSFAVGGFLRPTVNHSQPSELESSLLSRLPHLSGRSLVPWYPFRLCIPCNSKNSAMSKRVQRMIRPSCAL